MALIIWDGDALTPVSEPVPTTKPLYVSDIGVLVAPISQVVTTFVFNQGMAATSWIVQHNMNRRPSVTVVDSGGTEVIGDVQYISDNQVILTFSAAFAGKAYLN